MSFTGVAKVLKAMGKHLNINAHVGAISVNFQYTVVMHAVVHTVAIKTRDSSIKLIIIMFTLYWKHQIKLY